MMIRLMGAMTWLLRLQGSMLRTPMSARAASHPSTMLSGTTTSRTPTRLLCSSSTSFGDAVGGKESTAGDGAAIKKIGMVTVEANRAVAEAIHEMGELYLKNNNLKGSSYMMVAKSLRDCGHAIKDAKDADNLRGIGPAIADHVEEFLETGKIQRLEELRAGNG